MEQNRIVATSNRTKRHENTLVLVATRNKNKGFPFVGKPIKMIYTKNTIENHTNT